MSGPKHALRGGELRLQLSWSTATKCGVHIFCCSHDPPYGQGFGLPVRRANRHCDRTAMRARPPILPPGSKVHPQPLEAPRSVPGTSLRNPDGHSTFQPADKFVWLFHFLSRRGSSGFSPTAGTCHSSSTRISQTDPLIQRTVYEQFSSMSLSQGTCFAFGR